MCLFWIEHCTMSSSALIHKTWLYEEPNFLLFYYIAVTVAMTTFWNPVLCCHSLFALQTIRSVLIVKNYQHNFNQRKISELESSQTSHQCFNYFNSLDLRQGSWNKGQKSSVFSGRTESFAGSQPSSAGWGSDTACVRRSDAKLHSLSLIILCINVYVFVIISYCPLCNILTYFRVQQAIPHIL